MEEAKRGGVIPVDEGGVVDGLAGGGDGVGAARGVGAAAAAQGVHHPDREKDPHRRQDRQSRKTQDPPQRPLASGISILLLCHKDILSLRQGRRRAGGRQGDSGALLPPRGVS